MHSPGKTEVNDIQKEVTNKRYTPKLKTGHRDLEEEKYEISWNRRQVIKHQGRSNKAVRQMAKVQLLRLN